MRFSFMDCYCRALLIDQKRCPSTCAPEGLTHQVMHCTETGMFTMGGIFWHCLINTQRSRVSGSMNVKQLHYVFCCV